MPADQRDYSKSFEYRLGHRSGLELVINQYQVKTYQRSGIITNPNGLDDEQYIAGLIGQVLTLKKGNCRNCPCFPQFGTRKFLNLDFN